MLAEPMLLPMPMRAMLPIQLVGQTSSSLSPAASGDYVRAYLWRQTSGVPVRVGAAVVTFERLYSLGLLVVVCALLGLWLLRDQMSWRETLLLSWILVPAVFFQLWPVKGFQYLLPTAPPVALLAGRMLGLWEPPSLSFLGRRITSAAISVALCLVVLMTTGLETWRRIEPSNKGVFIAGSGGLPGGRKTGLWIRQNTPLGSEFLAIGPSMANLVSFYGYRKAYGISVGPNPLRRNPAYEPIGNADLALRRNEVQYIVWDAYSYARSPFFGKMLLAKARRYNGRLVFSVTMRLPSKDGASVVRPIIQVWKVRS